MIDQKELRLGNLVLDRQGDIAKVEILSDECGVQLSTYKHYVDSLEGSISYDEIEGIPFNGEWAVKCGFELTESKEEYILQCGRKKIIYVINDGYENHMILYQENIGMSYYDLNVDCDYVHQIQNLAFALTNEELEKK